MGTAIRIVVIFSLFISAFLPCLASAVLPAQQNQTAKIGQETVLADSISISKNWICAIRANDSWLACWHLNFSRPEETDSTPTIYPTAFASVSTGESHSCAIRANDSRIFCWGANALGQLGDGTLVGRMIPAPITDATVFSSVSPGYGFTCAIRANDSRLLFWGYDVFGDIPVSEEYTIKHVVRTPKVIEGNSTFSSVSAGSYLTQAIPLDSPIIRFWGMFGAPVNSSKYFSISKGETHACAIRKNDSKVFCWGSGSHGKLGAGDRYRDTEVHGPTQINDSAEYSQVSAGGDFTCAIRKNDSRILCWGSNQFGQLGDGKGGYRGGPYGPITQSSPVLFADPSSYSKVFSADVYACAIRSNDSRFLCWGRVPEGIPVSFFPFNKPAEAQSSEPYLFFFGTATLLLLAAIFYKLLARRKA